MIAPTATRVRAPHLRLEMTRRGWRSCDLARAANVSAGTVTAALHGRAISPRTLRKIAIALTETPIVTGLEDLIDGVGVDAAGR